jgi:FlaA1/EpsC-like NDP-sugar epimerase
MNAGSPAAALIVLVFGGTGVFGGRLVAGILGSTDLNVVVAGRNEARLAAFVLACNHGVEPDERPRVTPLILDLRNVTP